LFDRPFTATDATSLALLDAAADRALARRVAVEGAVLLKNANNAVLPLRPSSSVAIIGPLADDADAQAGGYTNGGADVVTVLSAAKNGSLAAGVTVTYAQGCNATGNSTAGFAAAIAAAKAADLVVAVVGDTGGRGWTESTCGEDDDRTDLDLPGVQPELLAAVAAAIAPKPLVVVLIHGRPVTFVRENLLGKLAAVVAAWRPGEEGGPAVWDLLLGRENPSGRLSQAWPQSVGYVHSQASPWFHKRQGDFDEESYRGGTSQQPGDKQVYPWGPLFTFQHGLSYTTFAAAVPTPGPPVTVSARGGEVKVAVHVTNMGTVAGKAVVAVYFSKPYSTFVRWHKMLGAFAKTPTAIGPGLTAVVELVLPVSKLSSYDPTANGQVVEPGDYALQVVCDDSTVALPTVTVTA
jgi:hypothetical protein